MKGKPLTLVGPELKAGDAAPDFQAVDTSLKPVNLHDTGSQVRIISVIPSLDTPVCDAQTKKFNEAASQLPGVDIYHGEHGPPVCPVALVRRVRRGQHQDAFGSPGGFFRRELWDAY